MKRITHSKIPAEHSTSLSEKSENKVENVSKSLQAFRCSATGTQCSRSDIIARHCNSQSKRHNIIHKKKLFKVKLRRNKIFLKRRICSKVLLIKGDDKQSRDIHKKFSNPSHIEHVERAAEVQWSGEDQILPWSPNKGSPSCSASLATPSPPAQGDHSDSHATGSDSKPEDTSDDQVVKEMSLHQRKNNRQMFDKREEIKRREKKLCEHILDNSEYCVSISNNTPAVADMNDDSVSISRNTPAITYTNDDSVSTYRNTPAVLDKNDNNLSMSRNTPVVVDKNDDILAAACIAVGIDDDLDFLPTIIQKNDQVTSSKRLESNSNICVSTTDRGPVYTFASNTSNLIHSTKNIFSLPPHTSPALQQTVPTSLYNETCRNRALLMSNADQFESGSLNQSAACQKVDVSSDARINASYSTLHSSGHLSEAPLYRSSLMPSVARSPYFGQQSAPSTAASSYSVDQSSSPQQRAVSQQPTPSMSNESHIHGSDSDSASELSCQQRRHDPAFYKNYGARSNINVSLDNTNFMNSNQKLTNNLIHQESRNRNCSSHIESVANFRNDIVQFPVPLESLSPIHIVSPPYLERCAKEYTISRPNVIERIPNPAQAYSCNAPILRSITQINNPLKSHSIMPSISSGPQQVTSDQQQLRAYNSTVNSQFSNFSNSRSINQQSHSRFKSAEVKYDSPITGHDSVHPHIQSRQYSRYYPYYYNFGLPTAHNYIHNSMRNNHNYDDHSPLPSSSCFQRSNHFLTSHQDSSSGRYASTASHKDEFQYLVNNLSHEDAISAIKKPYSQFPTNYKPVPHNEILCNPQVPLDTQIRAESYTRLYHHTAETEQSKEQPYREATLLQQTHIIPTFSQSHQDSSQNINVKSPRWPHARAQPHQNFVKDINTSILPEITTFEQTLPSPEVDVKYIHKSEKVIMKHLKPYQQSHSYLRLNYCSESNPNLTAEEMRLPHTANLSRRRNQYPEHTFHARDFPNQFGHFNADITNCGASNSTCTDNSYISNQNINDRNYAHQFKVRYAMYPKNYHSLDNSYLPTRASPCEETVTNPSFFVHSNYDYAKTNKAQYPTQRQRHHLLHDNQVQMYEMKLSHSAPLKNYSPVLSDESMSPIVLRNPMATPAPLASEQIHYSCSTKNGATDKCFQADNFNSLQIVPNTVCKNVLQERQPNSATKEGQTKCTNYNNNNNEPLPRHAMGNVMPYFQVNQAKLKTDEELIVIQQELAQGSSIQGCVAVVPLKEVHHHNKSQCLPMETTSGLHQRNRSEYRPVGSSNGLQPRNEQTRLSTACSVELVQTKGRECNSLISSSPAVKAGFNQKTENDDNGRNVEQKYCYQENSFSTPRIADAGVLYCSSMPIIQNINKRHNSLSEECKYVISSDDEQSNSTSKRNILERDFEQMDCSVDRTQIPVERWPVDELPSCSYSLRKRNHYMQHMSKSCDDSDGLFASSARADTPQTSHTYSSVPPWLREETNTNSNSQPINFYFPESIEDVVSNAETPNNCSRQSAECATPSRPSNALSNCVSSETVVSATLSSQTSSLSVSKATPATAPSRDILVLNSSVDVLASLPSNVVTTSVSSEIFPVADSSNSVSAAVSCFFKLLRPVLGTLLNAPEAMQLRPLLQDPGRLLEELVRRCGGEPSTHHNLLVRIKKNFDIFLKQFITPEKSREWGWEDRPVEDILQLLSSESGCMSAVLETTDSCGSCSSRGPSQLPSSAATAVTAKESHATASMPLVCHDTVEHGQMEKSALISSTADTTISSPLCSPSSKSISHETAVTRSQRYSEIESSILPCSSNGISTTVSQHMTETSAYSPVQRCDTGVVRSLATSSTDRCSPSDSPQGEDAEPGNTAMSLRKQSDNMNRASSTDISTTEAFVEVYDDNKHAGGDAAEICDVTVELCHTKYSCDKNERLNLNN